MISLKQRVYNHNKTHHTHIIGPLDHPAHLDMSFEGSIQKSILVQTHRDLKQHFQATFECKDLENKIFTLKSTSGFIMYDERTHQKRYLSHMDQFLAY